MTEMLACDWSASHYFNLLPSRLFSFMADGSVLVNEINFKSNFRTFLMSSVVFHPGKINSYKPIVSDVSDDDLMETVKQIEKSEKCNYTHTRSHPYDAIRRFQNNKGVARMCH